MEEEEFRQSGGGWWIRLIGIIVYVLIILAYAYQTLQMVSWLFVDSNLFMKIVTVFVCDGCATGYAMTEMFYRFRLRKSKHLVFGMWIVTFTLSTAATIVQMYLSSTNKIPHAIDASIITLAYGLVIAAFVVNIIAITVIIRMEHAAAQPVQRYLDDGPRRKVAAPQPAAHSQVTQIRQEEPVKQQLPAPSDAQQFTISPEDFELFRRFMTSAKAQQLDPQTAPLE